MVRSADRRVVDGPLWRPTWLGLTAVLVAQACAIVLDQPWPEGRTLLALTPEHGLTMGDLPAIPLALAAIAIALSAWRQARCQLGTGAEDPV